MLLYDREWKRYIGMLLLLNICHTMKWQEVDFASAKTKRSKYNIRPGNQATPPTRAELTKRKRINEDFNANQ